MTNLSDSARTKIIENGHIVYSAYAALNLATDVRGKIKVNGHYFNDYLHDLIIQKKTKDIIIIDNKKYHIHLKEIPHDKKNYRVEVLDENGKSIAKPSNIKQLADYNGSDAIALWANHPIIVSKDANSPLALEFKSNNQNYQIGGNKIDLYGIHITNLFNLLKRFEDKSEKLHTLFEMATGSGKSFTQALFAIVTNLAQVETIFAVPNKSLAKQLNEDFKRLLPDNMPSNNIMTHDELLIDHWKNLKASSKQDLIISIDEQHEAMREELLSERIKLLSKQHPLLLLTATPTENVFSIISNEKNKGVVELSRAAKEKLGMAKPAKNVYGSAQKTIDQFKTRNVLKKLLVRIVEMVEPERTSPAHEYVQQVQSAFHFRKQGEFHVPANSVTNLHEMSSFRHYLRWNVESPLGEKALIHAKGHDAIANLSSLIMPTGLIDEEEDDEFRFHFVDNKIPFQHGNRLNRRRIYQSIDTINGDDFDSINRHQQQELKDKAAIDSVLQAAKENFSKEHENTIRNAINNHIDFSNHEKYVRYRVCHGVLDNALQAITGLDNLQLDRKRFDNLEGLTTDVKNKLESIYESNESEQKFKHNLDEKLKSKLPDDALRNQVVEMICATNKELYTLMDGTPSSKDLFTKMVDNWSLDKYLHQEVFEKIFFKKDSFKKFIDDHSAIFLMTGLEHATTNIPANVPISRLKESVKNLNLMSVERNLSLGERLDRRAEQHYFKSQLRFPEADNKNQQQNREIIDNLFKMGLIGCYVSSEKVVGFNDPNLQNVGILIDSSDDKMNHPDAIVQAAGRNRGLNPARRPFCIATTNAGINISFNPEELEKDDARDRYWKAKKALHQQTLENLKIKMSQDIINLIDFGIDLEGNLDEAALHKKCIDIFLKSFHDLYNENEHDYQKTQTEFANLLQDLEKNFVARVNKIKKSNHASLPLRFMLSILNIIAHIYIFVKTRKTLNQLNHALKNSTYKDAPNQKTYVHLINSYGIKDTKKLTMINNDLTGTLRDVTEKVMAQPSRYLKKDNKTAKFDDDFKNKIAPIILMYIKDPLHQKQIEELINKKNWLDTSFRYLVANQDNLKIDNNSSLSSYEKIVKELLLSDRDIAKYFRENDIHFEKPDMETLLKNPALIASMGDIRETLGENIKFLQNMTPHIDHAELKRLLIKQIKPTINNKHFKNNIKQILAPLNETQLLAIMNAKGEATPENTAKRVTQLLQFKKDAQELTADALLDKYIDFTNNHSDNMKELFMSTPFAQVCLDTRSILNEVNACHNYFYHIYDAEDIGQPVLKTDKDNKDNESIWKKRVSSEHAPEYMLQIKRIHGFMQSLSTINELTAAKSEINNQHVLKTAKSIGTLSKDIKSNKIKKAAGLFSSFANIVKKGKKLTQEEINTPETRDKSAVEKMSRDAKKLSS